MTVSIPARSRLKAVPPPTRTFTPSPGERGSRKNSGSSGAHLVQAALLLLPVGTTDHGTGKQYWVGKVQQCPPKHSRTSRQNWKGTRTSGSSQERLPTGAQAPSRAAG